MFILPRIDEDEGKEKNRLMLKHDRRPIYPDPDGAVYQDCRQSNYIILFSFLIFISVVVFPTRACIRRNNKIEKPANDQFKGGKFFPIFFFFFDLIFVPMQQQQQSCCYSERLARVPTIPYSVNSRIAFMNTNRLDIFFLILFFSVQRFSLLP